MRITAPTHNQVFTITAAPAWPAIAFTTDGTGPHVWEWTLTWRTFSRRGRVATPGNSWDAGPSVTNLGGTLAVRATANRAVASQTVLIRGTNPAAADITAFLTTKPNSDGFGAIIAHETRNRHFRDNQEPIRSFDNGYGICQLTSPVPTFEQVWNWKLNIEAGLTLFGAKRATAITYLSQGGRTYTADQLRYETVCRWNGGSYHDWAGTPPQWQRRSSVLCDTATGNIGWDMTDSDNQGKTEAQLRARDSASYGRGRRSGDNWRYFGICYADRILG